jgi:hypothetical protein
VLTLYFEEKVLNHRNLKFLDGFSKNILISNFMKIRPVGSELFRTNIRTDRQTDIRDGVNIRFSQFCEHDRKIKGIFCFNYWECSYNYGYLKTRNDIVFMLRTVGWADLQLNCLLLVCSC